jgi:hypothetical protein
MILTVTPNVALDITYRVDRLAPGSAHRVREVAERAGSFDMTDYVRFVPHVVVEERHAPGLDR